jgi:glycosyltransferase involved in cell wall biosynthesis
MKKLSIVIPCYNESGSLPNLVQVCREACGVRKDVEFIFVDNGSSDRTQEIFNSLLAKPENAFAKLMYVPVNQGYGYGILQGLSLAEGEVLAWTHADLQTDPKDVIIAFDKFGANLALGKTMVKGERNGRSLFDVFFTASMSVISSFLLGSKLWDVNAQPKMFHRNFMAHLDVAPHDFSLDLYVLFKANQLGMKVQSFPVFFAKREFGEAKGGGSLKGKFKLIKRTFAYIFQLRNDIKQGLR